MYWSDFDLQQMNDEWVDALPADQVRPVLRQMLQDHKEARDRLNMNPENSSRPPGSMAPWESPARLPAPADDFRETPKAGVSRSDTQDKEGLPDDGARPVVPSPPSGKRPRGKQPGAPGYGRTQQLPVTDTCPHYPAVCAVCAGVLPQDGPMQAWTAWDQVDIVPLAAGQTGLRLCNTRHTLYQARCDGCGHITRAMAYRAPDDSQWDNTMLCQWRLTGPHLAAMIVILALRMRLSRARIKEFFGEFTGLSLSTGTIDQTIREAGRAGMPLEEELVAGVQQAALLNIDETSWMEWGKLLWLWTLVSTTTVYFAIGYRSCELLVNILEDKFTGILMSDGYAVYRHWKNRLRCWAHLFRKMRGLAGSTDARVAGIGRQMETIFDILMTAIYAARLDPPRDPLTLQHAKIIDDLRQICERHRDDAHKKVRALAREFLLDRDVILRQVREPHLPLTNNTAERSLRHWVISRLISHGTRSADGTRAFALLASVIETCRLRQASPWRYLATVIDASRKGLIPPSLPVAPTSAFVA